MPKGEEYAANCIGVNGSMLIPQGISHDRGAAAPTGQEVVELDMSEYQKMDGGLSSLIREVVEGGKAEDEAAVDTAAVDKAAVGTEAVDEGRTITTVTPHPEERSDRGIYSEFKRTRARSLAALGDEVLFLATALPPYRLSAAPLRLSTSASAAVHPLRSSA